MANVQISELATTKTDSTIDADAEYLAAEAVAGTTYKALIDDVVLAALAQTASTVAIASDVNVDSGTLFVDVSANNVGIGTSSPAGKLEINESTAADAFLYVTARGGNEYKGVILFRTKDSGGTNAGATIWHDGTALRFADVASTATAHMTIDGGDVGIGTTSPYDRLHINTGVTGSTDIGYVTVVSDYYGTGTSGGAGIRFSQDQTSEANLNARYASIEGIATGTYGDSMALLFKTANVSAGSPYVFERMRITASGNVGVGTASPSVKLQVAGAIAITDGMTAPSTVSGYAVIYVDSSTGDLTVKFGDGTTKTIVTGS